MAEKLAKFEDYLIVICIFLHVCVNNEFFFLFFFFFFFFLSISSFIIFHMNLFYDVCISIKYNFNT